MSRNGANGGVRRRRLDAPGKRALRLICPKLLSRLNRFRLRRQAGQTGDPFREPPGGTVVFGQAIDHGVQGDQSARRQDAGLPHAAAEHLPHASRLLDKLVGTA